MSSFTSSLGATVAPLEVDGYTSTSEHGNVVHRILASEDIDVTLRPASLRSGRMSLLFGEDDAGSAAAEDAFRAAAVWTLTPGTDPASVGMTFVVVGTVDRILDDTTRAVWHVGFGWQEVAP